MDANQPFGFSLTLLSFVYSLALTHLLLGVARMVRHRRAIRISPEHLLWTANGLTRPSICRRFH